MVARDCRRGSLACFSTLMHLALSVSDTIPNRTTAYFDSQQARAGLRMGIESSDWSELTVFDVCLTQFTVGALACI